MKCYGLALLEAAAVAETLIKVCYTRAVHHCEYGPPSDAHTLWVHDGGAQQRSNGAIYCRAPSLEDVSVTFHTFSLCHKPVYILVDVIQ